MSPLDQLRLITGSQQFVRFVYFEKAFNTGTFKRPPLFRMGFEELN